MVSCSPTCFSVDCTKAERLTFKEKTWKTLQLQISMCELSELKPSLWQCCFTSRPVDLDRITLPQKKKRRMDGWMDGLNSHQWHSGGTSFPSSSRDFSERYSFTQKKEQQLRTIHHGVRKPNTSWSAAKSINICRVIVSTCHVNIVCCHMRRCF